MRTPNLFIVGAPKCGTTSMYHYLKQHPEIFFPELKEPNFLNTDLVRKNRLTETEYFNLFADAKDEKYVGEATPLYLMSKDAPKKIKELAPDARIIIMLRKPVDLLYSAFFQNLYNGVEDIDNFEKALAAESDRAKGERIPKSNEPVDRLLYSKFVNFTEQIQEYKKYFSDNQIHVIIYDDLRKDTTAEIKETLNFLGLDANVEIDSRVHNESKKNKSNALHRFLKHPPKIVSGVAKIILSDEKRSKIYSKLRKANLEANTKQPLSEETEKSLVDQYSEEVTRLEKLLGITLPNWKKVK